MDKRNEPDMTIEEADDFVGNADAGGVIEVPTADEFLCSEDDVREECAMLGGAFEARFEY